MTPSTPLDRAFAVTQTDRAGDDDTALFYALLIETPLMVPVAPRAEDAPIAPQVFDLSAGPVALAFDDDVRMTGFFEGPVEYVALSGRAVIEALAEAGLGLGLNLGDWPSAQLLDADTVRWIRAEMGGDIEALDLSGDLTLAPPIDAPRALLGALAERIDQLPGLVREAWLVALSARETDSALALLLLPGLAARQAMPGIVTMLGRIAAVHGGNSNAVSVGVLDENHPLLAPARRLGHALQPPPRTDDGPAAARADRPPKLR